MVWHELENVPMLVEIDDGTQIREKNVVARKYHESS